MSTIKLYEFEPTRSARPRWTLLEAGLEYESINRGFEGFGTDEVKRIHPLGKLPAAVIDGKPLFESIAISTAIADLVPEKNLVPKPGSWERSLYEQWTLYVTTELEAHLWPNQLNTFLIPEEKRISACLEQNKAWFKRGAAGLDATLGNSDYLLGDHFTVADIVAGYTVNAARRMHYLEGFSNLQDYINRLLAREYCTLDKSDLDS